MMIMLRLMLKLHCFNGLRANLKKLNQERLKQQLAGAHTQVAEAARLLWRPPLSFVALADDYVTTLFLFAGKLLLLPLPTLSPHLTPVLCAKKK